MPTQWRSQPIIRPYKTVCSKQYAMLLTPEYICAETSDRSNTAYCSLHPVNALLPDRGRGRVKAHRRKHRGR